jgi:hypothetical protein
MQPAVHSVRRLSLNRFALLASALGAALVIGGLSLMLVSQQPIIETDTATINPPIPSVSTGREDDVLSVEWLTQRKATMPAVSTAREDDVLSAEWLMQRNRLDTPSQTKIDGAGHHSDCSAAATPAFCR